MAHLGRTNHLIIIRDADQGFYLDGGELGEILLPTRYVPEDVEQGDEIEIFLYRDSEDRLLATTEKPYCEAGQFANLKVLDVHPTAGVFLDWGLPKDLLLPYHEQLGSLAPGDSVVVYVMLDKKSDRIVATAKFNRFLNKTRPYYDDGDEVDLLIYEKTPLGFNAIVNNRHRGLLYHSDLQREVKIGERMLGYIRSVRDGDKIDLSLNASGYERVTNLTDQIMVALRQNDGRLDLGDRSPPEEIKRVFGTSKKAFKQAIGALYKKRMIDISGTGIRLVESEQENP